MLLLQSSQVKCPHQDSINEFIIQKLNPSVVVEQQILFYKNEVYAEKLVEFRIDGLDYYLRTSHKSYEAKDCSDKNT